MSDFGPIVDQVRLSDQYDSRDSAIVRVIWHHQASTNDDATIEMMVQASRQVSATYTVDNDDYKGRGWSRITGIVPERFRPWTSASYADEGALTIEMCNSTGDPSWGIADASHEAAARIAAYAFTEYGVPLTRASAGNDGRGHLGHSEVEAMFGDGYPTACPMHVDINRIIARARDLLDEDSSPSDPTLDDLEVEEMLVIKRGNGAAYLLVGDDLMYALKSDADVKALGNSGAGVAVSAVVSDDLFDRMTKGRTKK